jgi:hypothetical protein
MGDLGLSGQPRQPSLLNLRLIRIFTVRRDVARPPTAEEALAHCWFSARGVNHVVQLHCHPALGMDSPDILRGACLFTTHGPRCGLVCIEAETDLSYGIVLIDGLVLC